MPQAGRTPHGYREGGLVLYWGALGDGRGTGSWRREIEGGHNLMFTGARTSQGTLLAQGSRFALRVQIWAVRCRSHGPRQRQLRVTKYVWRVSFAYCFI